MEFVFEYPTNGIRSNNILLRFNWLLLNTNAVRVVVIENSVALAISIAANLGDGQHVNSRSRLRFDVDGFGRWVFCIDMFVADSISTKNQNKTCPLDHTTASFSVRPKRYRRSIRAIGKFRRFVGACKSKLCLDR